MTETKLQAMIKNIIKQIIIRIKIIIIEAHHRPQYQRQ